MVLSVGGELAPALSDAVTVAVDASFALFLFFLPSEAVASSEMSMFLVRRERRACAQSSSVSSICFWIAMTFNLRS